MEILLDQQEARLLGSLIEKELATPDYYPLSLSALTNACNQKSNRDPVVDYDEHTVQAVADQLALKGLVNKSLVGRVPKYEELFVRERNLVPSEAAVICVLLLRGPQTPGEIRGRTTRLYAFEAMQELMDVLGRLAEWGYIRRLTRVAGHKESRYSHLFGGEPPDSPAAAAPAPVGEEAEDDGRIDRLEQEMAELRRELADFKQEFERFRQQFE